MTAICLCFEAHQPFRLRRWSYLDLGTGGSYFDEEGNARILARVSDRCYRPATAMLRRLAGRHGKRFGISFSLTGTLVDQLGGRAPDVIESFQTLSKNGGVEFLAETHEHSLASLVSREEFESQIDRHRRKILDRFGQRPRVFRNTELIHSNWIAGWIEEMGFAAALVEGADVVLSGRPPGFAYRAAGSRNLRLLPRHYRLSDDIAFRFGDPHWTDRPLTPEKYVDWIERAARPSGLVNLNLDFETFGEHQARETGIFEFFEGFVALAVERGIVFLKASEAADQFPSDVEISCREPVSWADEARDISPWQGNPLQRHALDCLYRHRGAVLASGDARLMADWRRLTSSDHFYYMGTGGSGADAAVHDYFRPFSSPEEAFTTFMTVVADLPGRLANLPPFTSSAPRRADRAARQASFPESQAIPSR